MSLPAAGRLMLFVLRKLKNAGKIPAFAVERMKD